MVSVRLFRLRGVTCIEPVGGLYRFCFTWYSEYDLHQSGFPKAACRYRQRLHIYIPVTLVWVTMLPCAEVSIQETMFLTTASQYFHGPHENHLWVMAGDTAAKELWCLTRALRIIRENGSEDTRATPSPDLPQHKSDAPHRDA